MKYLFLFLIACFSNVSLAQDSITVPKTKFEIFLNFRHGFTGQVSNVPVEMRTPPKHEGDDWIYDDELTTGPLRDDTLYLNRPVLSMEFALAYNLDNNIQSGILLGLNFSNNGGPDNPGRHQQNQSGGSERGEGTSLRYYQVTVRALHVRLFLSYCTDWYKLISDVHFRFKIGTIIDPMGMRLAIDAGWDRWQQSTVWKTFTVAKQYQHGLFATFHLGQVRLDDKTKDEILGDAIIFAYIGFYLPLTHQNKTVDINYSLSQPRYLFGGIGLTF